MKHLIMGTAGHIDHGKTALIKALTGIDCDTHKEEKRRGITINLGFTHLLLDTGDTVGIIDVPGHRDFVHTMVSGASGIDFALLTIAANEGVMPQTREHIHIMEILGINSGIIAITKIDLMDDGAAIVAHNKITEFAKGEYLDKWPIVSVSSITGKGIDCLKVSIALCAKNVLQRPATGIFRMYVDRAFSVSGFGTVVTGSIKSGELHSGDSVYVLPGEKQIRVKRLERYGEQTDAVYAGDRASCNVAGINREDFKRGMLISNSMLEATTILDATVALFIESKELGIWTPVVFFLGAFESQARVHVLDKNSVARGGSALIQIHLDKPCIAMVGDRFVIRSTSGDATLGGGEVIDAHPLHHRRRPKKLIENLSNMAQGQMFGRIAVEVRKHVCGLNIAELAALLATSEQDVRTSLNAENTADIKIVYSTTNVYCISLDAWEKIKEKVLLVLGYFHKENPLLAQGKSSEDLLGVIGAAQKKQDDDFSLAALDCLVKDGVLNKIGRTFALPGHSAALSTDALESSIFVENYFKNCVMQTPVLTDLQKQCAVLGIDEKKLQGILRYLVENKILCWIEGAYLYAPQVDICRTKLVAALKAQPQGLTVAKFRDVVEGNRKICLLLFALFEKEGIVKREGDVRVRCE